MSRPSSAHRSRRQLLFLALLTLHLAAASTIGAADYYWDANGDGSGTGGAGAWTTNGRLWRLNGSTTALARWRSVAQTSDRAVFAGTSGIVQVGSGIYAHDLLFATSGYTLSGNSITLSGVAPTITVGGTSTSIATISAVLAGTNVNLVKNGSGVLALGAVNTFTGSLSINAGTVRLAGATDRDFINRDCAITINGGTFDLGNFIEDTDTFTLNGGTITGGASAGLGVITSSSSAATAFDMRAGKADVILSNPFSPWSGDATAVGLTKTTSGIVTLTRANTYTGATRILAGTLVLDGSIARQSAVTVAAGATFAGTGTTNNAAVTVNGTISPGAMSDTGVSQIGTLTTGAQTWNGGGTYVWQIADAAGVAGGGWDLLQLGGSLTVGATATNPFTLELIGLGTNGASGTVANFDGTQSYVWTLLTTSTISGLASSNVVIDSTLFTASNPISEGKFSLVQSGSSLNLVFTPVPEPATYALALGVGTLGFAAVRQWRRRREPDS
ncbi:MAG: autotransporter-associated beta strand repeat-containing protein [Opitutaceae bacterium]